MKILCTTDFSKVSVNAIKWTIDFLSEIGGGEIHILHCLGFDKRSNMFISMEEILKEKAIDDLEMLRDKLNHKVDSVSISYSIVKALPRDYIPKKAEKIGASFIVLGTTGLTSLKNMTVGSVTMHIANNTTLPIIAIPPGKSYSGLEDILIGIGKKELNSLESLDPIQKIKKASDSDLHFVQVNSMSDRKVTYDERLPKYFGDQEFKLDVVHAQDDIVSSLNNQADKVNADILCLVHQKDSWIKAMFRDSLLSQELFNIKLPVLILPDA